jgi:phosphatidylserine/phosphatidylglycerophosphate/cardiolipin synthase-like enzyme
LEKWGDHIMPVVVGNIEVHMGPHQLGGPDNLLGVIVDFIDGAQKKLLIAVQEIDSKEIAEAIIRAKQRKVLVKLVLEADYLLEKVASQFPFLASGENETNRELHNAILRASINVRSDFNPDIFHQKFIIRDSVSVLTGSTNFTQTDTSSNLNHIVIVHDKAVAKQYDAEYDEIQQGHFGKLNEGHDPKPAEVMVSNVRVKTLFAPDHNPEMEIMKQIAKAKSRVDFAIFTFAASSGIDDQLAFARHAGIAVRGALFKSQANQTWAATETLKDAGVTLSFIPRSGLPSPRPRKLHHKLMVIDEQLIIAGSFNYTGPATLLNDENILVLGDLDATDGDSIQKQKQLAGYALKEIDRMIRDFGTAPV